jgi:hypothetical protein
MRLSLDAFTVYKNLLDRNPSYQTKVGNIQLKYANEIMSRVYELSLFGFKKDASRIFRKMSHLELYPKFWERYAFDILNSVDNNAILFTNGDNDTYPLLWAQRAKSYREDVTIVNLSLLNDPMYINLLNKNKFFPGNLFPGLNENNYTALVSKSLHVEPPGNKNDRMNYSQNLKSIVRQLEDNTAQLAVPPGSYMIPYLLKDGLIDTLNIHGGIPGRPLSFSEFFVQGLLYFNIGKTPIYFIKGMQPAFKQMIEEGRLIDKGFVYQVEKPIENTFHFSNQWYDKPSLEKLAKKSHYEPSEIEGPSESHVYQLILEAEAVIIYNLTNKDSINLKMRDFIQKHPLVATN